MSFPSCRLLVITLVSIAVWHPAYGQDSKSPTSDEIASCDAIVRAYHQKKYPEMLASSDRTMALDERSGSRMIHIAKGGRDRVLAANDTTLIR